MAPGRSERPVYRPVVGLHRADEGETCIVEQMYAHLLDYCILFYGNYYYSDGSF